MPENPFDQTTLPTDSAPGSTPFGARSTPLASGNAIEVRYPHVQRVIVPLTLVSSGFIVPIILFFALPTPMNLLMAAITFILEISSAAFMYFLFNSAFVRADDAGITKSQLGKTQSVRWEEIADMVMLQIGNGPTQITFKDASGKEVFKCSTLTNGADGEKLMEFIDEKLQKQ